MKILGVTENSIAEELEIAVGDELLAFDGYSAVDVLDYEYYNSQENFTLSYSHNGEITECDIEKYSDEDLGLEIEREIPVISCKNNCLFCFVNQLPKSEKLRNTLQVKDDDYRHSFISGNYVTLTNLSDFDIDRIIRLQLSPLYISVHTTNADLRLKMLGVKKAPDINAQLSRLKRGGIIMHTQIVYCPDFNDDLEASIKALSSVAASLAIVPVGLTKDCNPILKPVDKAAAEKVISVVEKWQKKLLPKTGTRFVFAADEFYIKAEAELPPYEDYEDFGQIENGVGLLAAFENEFDYALQESVDGKIGNISIATGVSAHAFISKMAKKLTDRFGGEITVYKIENNFFGTTVTVAGLVVGRDIEAALISKPLGERLLLPRTMLKEFGDVFLDNMTVSELEKNLSIKIQVCPPDGEGFVKAILKLNSQQ